MRAFPRSSNDVSAVVGVLLLVVPTYFVTMSALRHDAPGLKFFGSPILILGTLAIAFETHFVIGHENSLLHRKIYFGVDSAPSPTKNVQ